MRYVLRPLALWWRYFPQLAALYLLGVLGRRGAIELAAFLGWNNELWAALVMPFAGLARLGSYVAMFLVLRPAIPALAALPRRSARSIDVFSNVIVPFFAIYLAWRLFAEDWLAFETRALDYRIDRAVTAPAPAELNPDTLPGGSVTAVVIVAAILARVLLSRFKDRLPDWMIAVRVYVDALWVFVGVSFAASKSLTLFVNPGQWVSERRVVVWLNETRAEVFSHVRPIEVAWDAAMLVLRTVFGGATIPLLWLAVAGIVYGAAMPDWRSVARRMAGDRADEALQRAAPNQKRLNARLARIPRSLRDTPRDWLRKRLGNYTDIVDSARLILHGGVSGLSLYVLGYLVLAWLDMAGAFYHPEVDSGHLFRGVAWLLGPHPLTFWNGVADIIATASHLIIEPLRVCLIASTVAYCLEHVQTRPATTTSAP